MWSVGIQRKAASPRRVISPALGPRHRSSGTPPTTISGTAATALQMMRMRWHRAANRALCANEPARAALEMLSIESEVLFRLLSYWCSSPDPCREDTTIADELRRGVA
jgi:hypothetical protein